MNLRLTCPHCEASCYIANVATLPVSRDAESSERSASWTCPACRQPHQLTLPDLHDRRPLTHCAACGNSQFYRQKNFPQWLGLSILAAACASFFVLQGLYLPKLAWAILLGSAAFDGLLYLFVGDVIVCYRCQARHYGLPRNRAYEPFELSIAEKYRQERLRREMHESDAKSKV